MEFIGFIGDLGNKEFFVGGLLLGVNGLEFFFSDGDLEFEYW